MKKDKLPELSHLQFAVLEVLGAGVMAGKKIRAELAEQGIRKSGPAFYQMMARLEEAKMIEGWYNQEIIDGQIIKERNYKMTGEGARALNRTKHFYASKTEPLTLGGTPAFA